ncbi:MAG: radical SAM family heme chaperone HemW [Succinivibrio sp.]|nr:radical SAM family heme chaperone HemW [Succinivibrio sp.]
MDTPLPLSLYIHYPWCVRKCPYCDFNSRPKGQADEERYVRALVEDYLQQRDYLNGRLLRSVYLGGGTPSLLPTGQLATLLEAIMPDCADDCEISMEANPGTVSLEQLREYRRLGINRLSLGVQSFSTQSLKALGRIYDGETAKLACRQVREAGFENFNLDLMHGTPQQTVAQGLDDLRTALGFAPAHLSWYELTIEEGTPFYVRCPRLPSEQELFELEQEGRACLLEAGFVHYEVSAYAREDSFKCRHNLNYWYFGDYLGIGAGAHAKLFIDGRTLRRANPEEPAAYVAARSAFFKVKDEDLPFEFLLNRLRIFGRVSLAEFVHTTGLDEELIRPKLRYAQEQGLAVLSADESALELTALGKTMLNDILMYFLE